MGEAVPHFCNMHRRRFCLYIHYKTLNTYRANKFSNHLINQSIILCVMLFTSKLHSCQLLNSEGKNSIQVVILELKMNSFKKLL